MTKRDIVDAIRSAKKAGQNRPVKLGDLTVWCQKLYSQGVGFAWHWIIWAHHPCYHHNGGRFGGWSRQDDAADSILKTIGTATKEA